MLLHLATAGLFRARWTSTIHQEWIESLLRDRPDLPRERLERTRQLMDAAVPDCLVVGFENLIPTLELPDPHDRHVLAAAIYAGADLIVTFNVSDFPPSATRPHDIDVVNPDDFAVDLLNAEPDVVCRALAAHRANLKRPPKSVDEYLDNLRKQQLPRFVTAIEQYTSRL